MLYPERKSPWRSKTETCWKLRAATKVVKMINKSLVYPMRYVLMRSRVQAADGYPYKTASVEEWIRREQAGAARAPVPSTNLRMA